MKRSEALSLIANKLDFLNGTFKGFRLNHTKEELQKADVILTALESAGFQPPNITLEKLIPGELKSVKGTDINYYACYEPEKNTEDEDDTDNYCGAV